MHDAFLKSVFADPRMAEILIRHHAPEWATEIDFSTLREEYDRSRDDQRWCSDWPATFRPRRWPSSCRPCGVRSRGMAIRAWLE